MLTKDTIKLIIQAAIGVLLLIMLIRKDKPEPDNREAIKAYDVALQTKQQFIEYLKEDNAWMDNHIRELRERDSVLLSKIISNQPKYTANEKRLNEIPAAVNNLDKTQLRREFANY